MTMNPTGPAGRGSMKVRRSHTPGELAQLVKEVKGQLKKIAITASNRKDQMFLGVDMDRQGYISKDNLRDLCVKQHLPDDDDIINGVRMHSMFVSLVDLSNTIKWVILKILRYNLIYFLWSLLSLQFILVSVEH